MPTLLIRNGRLIEPRTGLDQVRDLWIANGKVAPLGFTVPKPDEVIDATGMIVMPGFVDLHVHLREPGNQAAETLETGCAAALAGGFTSIVCMPNTRPCLDTPDIVEDLMARANALNGPRVAALPAVTVRREGKVLTDLKALMTLPGVVGFTDDGAGVESESLLRKALDLLTGKPHIFAEHCEFTQISAGGLMHPGHAAQRAGLLVYPPEAETAMIERDIRLSRETGARVHFQHLSAARSVELVSAAKARGVRVTAEVTPHHLILTDEDAARGGTNFKTNPPLRSEADRQALVQALRQGVIDAIATDHAPHTPESKSQPFADATFGVIGMETAAAVVWTYLVRTGIITPIQMAERMNAAPARAFPGITVGDLVESHPCDAVIFDPCTRWTVNPAQFKSRSRNCPFAGWELEGRVIATIVHGEVRYRDGLR